MSRAEFCDWLSHLQCDLLQVSECSRLPKSFRLWHSEVFYTKVLKLIHV